MFVKLVVPGEFDTTFECDMVTHAQCNVRDNYVAEVFGANVVPGQDVSVEVFRLSILKDGLRHAFYHMNDDGKTIDKRIYNRNADGT